ncbi:fibronectin type III domain-containing protein [Ruminiclostridium cellobioparum]|jgi:chitodextrinase|uniref:fibronectin type III domain-containing protein n=1 Tax=Ruminiclostridium cellobioparum TaxID=29355 RepID=UPI0028AF043F|nr:fibronectin type III domain-containing protein [Ruminiclostridium cellobioparum]
MHQATYINWDFTNIWHIIEGATYAYLRDLPNLHHYVDIQAPTSPQKLNVLSKTINSITISWDPSTDNIGVAGYKIYRDGKEIGISTTNQYTDTDLKDGTTYVYIVKAFDFMENTSLPSNELTATKELNVPLQLTINLPERIHVNNPLSFSTNPDGVGTVIWTLQKVVSLLI